MVGDGTCGGGTGGGDGDRLMEIEIGWWVDVMWGDSEKRAERGRARLESEHDKSEGSL